MKGLSMYGTFRRDWKNRLTVEERFHSWMLVIVSRIAYAVYPECNVCYMRFLWNCDRSLWFITGQFIISTDNVFHSHFTYMCIIFVHSANLIVPQIRTFGDINMKRRELYLISKGKQPNAFNFKIKMRLIWFPNILLLSLTILSRSLAHSFHFVNLLLPWSSDYVSIQVKIP